MGQAGAQSRTFQPSPQEEAMKTTVIAPLSALSLRA
jgi:hypothetical protein